MLYAPPRHARRARDFYSTPPELTAALRLGLPQLGLDLPVPAYDPCAGDGRLLQALGAPGFGSDLFPAAYPACPWIIDAPVDASDPDALAEALGASRAIVSNPPYGRDAARIVHACVKLLEADAIELAALLLPLPWEAAGSASRLALMRHALFRGRIVCCWRPEWIEDTGGGGKMNSAWLVWARQGSGNASVYVSKASLTC